MSNINSIHEWAQKLRQFDAVVHDGLMESSPVISNLTELISVSTCTCLHFYALCTCTCIFL